MSHKLQSALHAKYIKHLYTARMSPEFVAHSEHSKLVIDTVKSWPATSPELNHHERRREVHRLSIQFCKAGLLKTSWLKTDFMKYAAAVSPLLFWDMGVLTKIVIHFQLFGGTIMELGTDIHEKWIKMTDNGDMIAGFAMTEIGHGSNVQAIETRADYDPETEEFVLTSPTDSSTKMMIGNVGVHGEVVVLFAQLYLHGECKGVHAFIVQVRTLGSQIVLPGIEIGDIGLKSSWNEVDNAWIRFNGARIPRTHLLNKFAHVERDGTYHSMVTSPSKLFALTMSQLMVGRINYVAAPIIGLQYGLHVALRYALSRRQFSEGKNQPENVIMNYPSHTVDSMTLLAMAICLQFARNSVIRSLEVARRDESFLTEYHCILSGLKAFVCEYVYVQLGKLRVMCGGAGIVWSNMIGCLHNYFDPFQTAEGDRTVLYQQLGKYLLGQAMKKYSGFVGALTLGKEVFAASLIQFNPLLAWVESNGANLSKPVFIVKSLFIRQEMLLSMLAGEIQNHLTATEPLKLTQAWNACLLSAIEAAQAYVEYFIINESFKHLVEINNTLSKSSGDELILQKKLFSAISDCISTAGLHLLNNASSFFLKNRMFSPFRCQSIEKAWHAHCQNLRTKHLEDLLASSEVVVDFVRAPQGQPDGDYVKHMLAAFCPSQAKL